MYRTLVSNHFLNWIHTFKVTLTSISPHEDANIWPYWRLMNSSQWNLKYFEAGQKMSASGDLCHHLQVLVPIFWKHSNETRITESQRWICFTMHGLSNKGEVHMSFDHRISDQRKLKGGWGHNLLALNIFIRGIMQLCYNRTTLKSLWEFLLNKAHSFQNLCASWEHNVFLLLPDCWYGAAE